MTCSVPWQLGESDLTIVRSEIPRSAESNPQQRDCFAPLAMTGLGLRDRDGRAQFVIARPSGRGNLALGLLRRHTPRNNEKSIHLLTEG